MTKQTGPGWAVKRFSRFTMLAAVIALPGCGTSGEWTNPNKSAAEMRADVDTCNKDSEEDTLQREGRARADASLPTSPTPGSLGPSPMQLHDQAAAAKDFHRSYDDCMESKGYRRGTAAN